VGELVQSCCNRGIGTVWEPRRRGMSAVGSQKAARKDNIVSNYKFMKQILSRHLQQLEILGLVLCLVITSQHQCPLTTLTSFFNFSLLH
jgi:hypothetical protein